MYVASAGGSALKGETALEDAKRELKEETGIKANELIQIYHNKCKDTIYMGYLCESDCDKDLITLQEEETISFDWLEKAIEIEADMLFMAKNIDGVYDIDPRYNKNAKRYQQVSYDTCVSNRIKACDSSAFILAEEFGVMMYLYDGKEKNVILNMIEGKPVGTVIKKNCTDVYY